MSEYKVNPEWDFYIKDDGENPVDVTFTEVIESFERLYQQAQKAGLLVDNPEDVQERVDSCIYWIVNLLGLRDLHKRYHELTEIVELVRDTTGKETS